MRLNEGALAELVYGGDLGRQAAAQFPHATWVEVPNVGHTPTADGRGRLARHFVRALSVPSGR